MIRVLVILKHTLLFLLLTVLTQVGGIIYLLCLGISHFLTLKFFQRSVLFWGIYLLFALAIIPLLAPLGGRVALPLYGELCPRNIVIVLANRHYVRPVLKQELEQLATNIQARYPGTSTLYLDANFPFVNGFPLLPHRSHDDGRKVDLAFYYQQAGSQEPSKRTPSWIGYGGFEAPLGKEANYPKQCAQKGYWQYNAIKYIAPFAHSSKLKLDAKKTAYLIRLMAKDPRTGKIFLEPHLKQRWGLSGFNNIRFHGCAAVRHDDHIHLQL